MCTMRNYFGKLQLKEKGRLFGFSSQLREHLIMNKITDEGEPVERQVEYHVKEHLEMTYPGICCSD